MVEMIVVLAIGSILVSMAIEGFGNSTSRMAVRSARQSFGALKARARAYAVERGQRVDLNIDPAGDSVWIESGGTRIDFLDYAEERDVDVRSSTAGIITLCLTPRGYAETYCNSFGNNSVALAFVQGQQSSSLIILPMGQLQW